MSLGCTTNQGSIVMTEDSKNDDEEVRWTPEGDPDGYSREDITPKDWFLETVLDFAHGMNDEQTGGMVGLTLTSNGAVVSGLAISRAEWIAAIPGRYKQGGASETAPYIEDIFKQSHDAIVERASERDDADLPTRARGFIHMRDVRIGVWLRIHRGAALARVPG